MVSLEARVLEWFWTGFLPVRWRGQPPSHLAHSMRGEEGQGKGCFILP